ncbi:hypothetical protein M0Q97_07360 [Candidatus Dojkabacteria bacterium]|jgi:hypothetical protein|nr:hypothetical protein [Candidatus Dojkabacteria bacterium]
MSKQKKLIKAIFYQNGYSTVDTLSDVELLYFNNNELYFTDGGISYKASMDTTSPEIVS